MALWQSQAAAASALFDLRSLLLQVAAWREATAASYTEVWLEGAGHNYVTAPPQALLVELQRSLQVR